MKFAFATAFFENRDLAHAQTFCTRVGWRLSHWPNNFGQTKHAQTILRTNQNSKTTCIRRQARENAFKQVTIGFGFTSDWLEKVARNFQPITKQGSSKPKQLRNYFGHILMSITFSTGWDACASLSRGYPSSNLTREFVRFF